MSKSPKFVEVIRACEAASKVKKPNLTPLSHQFNVSYGVLRCRLRRDSKILKARRPPNTVLNAVQEKALIYWIDIMQKNNIPITRTILLQWANYALIYAGSTQKTDMLTLILYHIHIG